MQRRVEAFDSELAIRQQRRLTTHAWRLLELLDRMATFSTHAELLPFSHRDKDVERTISLAERISLDRIWLIDVEAHIASRNKQLV